MVAACHLPYLSRLHPLRIRRGRLLRHRDDCHSRLRNQSENLLPARGAAFPARAHRSYAPTRRLCFPREQNQDRCPADSSIRSRNPIRPAIFGQKANRSRARTPQSRARFPSTRARQPGPNGARSPRETNELRRKLYAPAGACRFRPDNSWPTKCWQRSTVR